MRLTIRDPSNPLPEFRQLTDSSGVVVLSGFEDIHDPQLIRECVFLDGVTRIGIVLYSGRSLDMSLFNWPRNLYGLSVNALANCSVRPSVAHGLDVPASVKELWLSEYGTDAAAPLEFRVRGQLTLLYLDGVDASTVIRICGGQHSMERLQLRNTQLGGSDLSWIPPSVQSITLQACGVRCIPPGYFPVLQEITITGGDIAQLPQRMDEQFPSLQTLDLSGNGITGIAAVIFPVGLSRLVLEHNKMTAIDALLLPDGIRDLSLCGNPVGDWRSVFRHLLRTGNRSASLGFGDERDMHLREAWLYGDARYHKRVLHMDVIAGLLSARRIPRLGGRSAVKKLPADLLRAALDYLGGPL